MFAIDSVTEDAGVGVDVVVAGWMLPELGEEDTEEEDRFGAARDCRGTGGTD